MSQLQVKVAAIQDVSAGVRHFTLVDAHGGELPAFSGGSHIVVTMPAPGRTYRNAYSLLSSPEDRAHYEIAVHRQPQSRGGSIYMHEEVKVGSVLDISYPVNLFALSRVAKHHLLIAGGIGITPFMAQIHDLERLGGDYSLHYGFRSREHAAFADALKGRVSQRAVCYDESLGQRMDFDALLRAQPLGTHVYACGPQGMVEALVATARALGWPEHHIHSEQFLAPPVGEPFTLKLSKSELEITVQGDMSMLEALEAAGVDAPSLCRGGACGRCELEVLGTDGELQHHDHYLSDADKASGRKIMPCVSRAKCGYLELNL